MKRHRVRYERLLKLRAKEEETKANWISNNEHAMLAGRLQKGHNASVLKGQTIVETPQKVSQPLYRSPVNCTFSPLFTASCSNKGSS